MSGCNSNQNYYIQNNRSTSRVLNPPGGRSSFSIGGFEPDASSGDNSGKYHRQRQEYPTDSTTATQQPRTSAQARSSGRGEDMSCDIPGLEDHYRTIAKRYNDDRDTYSKPPRQGGRHSEAVHLMKSNVRKAEVQSVRRSPRNLKRNASPMDLNVNSAEKRLSVPKRRAHQESRKDSAAVSATRKSSDNANPRRREPPRDAYESVLKSEGPSIRSRREDDSGSNTRKRVSDVKLIGGMDRRGPAIPPGGNSSLSLGWD